MPCDMMSGITSGDTAQMGVDQLRREVQDLRERVASLEQAMCAVMKMHLQMSSASDLRTWYQAHIQRRGHQL
jgi:hypothetical protein